MNQSNTTELRIDYEWALKVTYVLETYVIRLVGASGLLLNAFSVKVLLDRSLRHKIYDFMLCRVLCSVVLCLFVAGYVEKCYKCQNSYLNDSSLHFD